MTKQKNPFIKFKNKVLENYQRTSIQLEKKANILFFSTIICTFLLSLLFILTACAFSFSLKARLFFLGLEFCAIVNCIGVLYLLNLGKYNVSSQLFLWGNIILGYLPVIDQMNIALYDFYWIIIVTALLLFMAIMLSIRKYQIRQVLIVSATVYTLVGIIYGIQIKSFDLQSFSIISTGALVLLFLGILAILLARFANESVSLAQEESNNNMIKLSKLKLISSQLPKDIEKLSLLIDDFSVCNSKTSEVIVSRLNGLELSLRKIMSEIETIFKEHPEYKNENGDKFIYLSENGQLLLNSVGLVKELTSELAEMSLKVDQLNKDSKNYVSQFKKDLNQF